MYSNGTAPGDVNNTLWYQKVGNVVSGVFNCTADIEVGKTWAIGIPAGMPIPSHGITVGLGCGGNTNSFPLGVQIKSDTVSSPKRFVFCNDYNLPDGITWPSGYNWTIRGTFLYVIA